MRLLTPRAIATFNRCSKTLRLSHGSRPGLPRYFACMALQFRLVLVCMSNKLDTSDNHRFRAWAGSEFGRNGFAVGRRPDSAGSRPFSGRIAASGAWNRARSGFDGLDRAPVGHAGLPWLSSHRNRPML